MIAILSAALVFLAGPAAAQSRALNELKSLAPDGADAVVSVPASQPVNAAAPAAKSSGSNTRVIIAPGGLKITIVTDKQIVKTAAGVELDRVIREEDSGSLFWWNTSPEALSNITQGLFCEAYEACAKDGAFLAGGYKQESSDCTMKNYDSIEQEYAPDGYRKYVFTAVGALHFKCIDKDGAAVPAE